MRLSTKSELIDWLREKPLACILVAATLGALYAASIKQLSEPFGYTLYFATPFCIGFIAVFSASYFKNQSIRSACFSSFTAISLASLLHFFSGLDGLISLCLSYPLTLLVALLGGIIGQATSRAFSNPTTRASILATACMMVPTAMTLEFLTDSKPELHRIVHSVDIAASPDLVWEKITNGNDEGFLSRSDDGPKSKKRTLEGSDRANSNLQLIENSRYERLESWETGALIRFDILDHSLSLKELSPYERVRNRSFIGIAESRAGQFRIVATATGHTQLEYTTWYYTRRWPHTYWTSISDLFVNTQQIEIASYIKAISEAENPPEQTQIARLR